MWIAGIIVSTPQEVPQISCRRVSHDLSILVSQHLKPRMSVRLCCLDRVRNVPATRTRPPWQSDDTTLGPNNGKSRGLSRDLRKRKKSLWRSVAMALWAPEQQSNRATEHYNHIPLYRSHDERPTRTSWSASYIDSLYTRQFLRFSILSRLQDT
jgi:hypothetical protein